MGCDTAALAGRVIPSSSLVCGVCLLHVIRSDVPPSAMAARRTTRMDFDDPSAGQRGIAPPPVNSYALPEGGHYVPSLMMPLPSMGDSGYAYPAGTSAVPFFPSAAPSENINVSDGGPVRYTRPSKVVPISPEVVLARIEAMMSASSGSDPIVASGNVTVLARNAFVALQDAQGHVVIPKSQLSFYTKPKGMMNAGEGMGTASYSGAEGTAQESSSR